MGLIQRLIWVIFLLWITNSLVAQDFIPLYEDYLPPKILQNKQHRKDLNARLKLYGEYDPKLIYYYITHLNLKYQQKITDFDSNLSETTKKLFIKSKIAKIIWVRKQLKEIQNSKVFSLKSRKVSSYFKKYDDVSMTPKQLSSAASKTQKDSTEIIPFDKNKMNFFTYLYLAGKEQVKYDPSIDYFQLIRLESEQRIKHFSTYYQNSDDISMNEREVLSNEALQYSFLFKNTYLEEYKQTTDFSCQEFVSKVFESEYLNRHRVFFAFTYADMPVYVNESKEFADPLINLSENEIKYSISSQFSAWGGIAIRTTEDYQSFSSISIRAGLAISTTLEDENLGNTIISNGIRTIPHVVWFNGTYAIGKARNINITVFTSQFTTPIYYISKKFFIEAGIHYSMKSASFEYDIIRDGELDDKTGELPETLKVDVKDYKVSPIFSVVYQTPWLLNFRGDIFLPELIRFGMEFSIFL